MTKVELYVLMRYPVELIGIYKTIEEARDAYQDFLTDNNEDEFYIESDYLYL